MDDEGDLDPGGRADRNAVAPAGFVEMLEDGTHFLEIGWRELLHVRADGRTENAQGRKGTEPGDEINRLEALNENYQPARRSKTITLTRHGRP